MMGCKYSICIDDTFRYVEFCRDKVRCVTLHMAPYFGDSAHQCPSDQYLFIPTVQADSTRSSGGLVMYKTS